MKAPKVPMIKGIGRSRDEERQGDIQPMAAGHQVVAHFVRPQDQQQGEGKRDAPVKQPGRGKGVHPLLDGPGDDGGDHRGQQQHQVQAQPSLPYRLLPKLAPESALPPEAQKPASAARWSRRSFQPHYLF